MIEDLGLIAIAVAGVIALSMLLYFIIASMEGKPAAKQVQF
jgi:hypothetical protein